MTKIEISAYTLITKASSYHKKQVLIILSYYELIYRTGFGEQFQDWKKIIADISTETNIPLYDFTGYNNFTGEPIPTEKNNTSLLKWFWEPSHYTEELGHKLLNSMSSLDCNSPSLSYTDQNIILNKENLSENLERFSAVRKSFLIEYPVFTEVINNYIN